MKEPSSKSALDEPTSELNSAELAKKATALATAANGAAQVLGQVAEVVRICADCVKAIEAEQTEQTRIDRRARVQIELIRERRELMVTFLNKTFAERRQNFQELFQRLDVALERDHLEGTKEVLAAITDLAKSSPFEALRDAASAHEGLKDKCVVWDL